MTKPKIIGRCAVFDEIAAGGMATVHLGRLLAEPVKRSLPPLLSMALVIALAPPAARADVTRAQCAETYERAQRLRREAKLTEAREALLICSQDACPAVVKNECIPWFTEVERAIPSVVVAVRDGAGKDVIGANFSIDGAPMSPVEGRPVSLDPGRHELRVEAPDGDSMEEEVVIRAGEKNHALTLVVARSAAVASAAAPHEDKPVTEPPGKASSGPSMALPIGVAAFGVVAIGASVFFGVQAKSQADDVRARCAPYCKDADLDPVRTKLLASDIGLGVGLLALVAATYLWLSAPSSPKANAPAATITAGGRRGAFTIRF